jgi:hypothetical protein
MHLRAVLFAFSISLTAFAQDTVTRTFGAQFSHTPSDYYLGANYSFLSGRFEHRVQAELGMLRTALQFRAFPQISYQLGFQVVDLHKMRAGVFLRPAFNVLQVNRSAKNGWVFSEALYPGVMAEYGSKNRFRLSAAVGPWIEQSYSDPRQTFRTAFRWQYLIEISWSHALR